MGNLQSYSIPPRGIISEIGLAVNLICAWLLRDDHGHHQHDHGHHHHHDHGHHHHDAEMDAPVVEEIREVVAELPVPATITDLHVWRVGKDQYACILSLATQAALSADSVRQALSVHEELAHITVEVNALG